MTFSLKAFIAFAVAALTAITPALSHASYPEQPIKMIVAYGAGGGTDMVARLLARHMEKHLSSDLKTDAKIVVVNRPGAGGGIGFAELAAAPADGYTIGFINTPNVLTIPIERKSNFHWTKYDLIGNVVDDPGNFSVHNDSPIKNLADLVAYARANPEKVTVGTTGVGSDDHLAMLMFERIAKVKMTHVPFKGAVEVHQAVVGKQIMVAAINIGEALQYAKGGSPLRQLGQMSKAKTTLAPTLATFKEQGFDIVLASLRGLAAPQNLPTPVREALVRAVDRTLKDPQFQSQAAAMFAPLRHLAPAAYTTELREAEAGFAQLWKELPWSDK
jgi:tripartite-type tricarboxylate transporter receptor subunit TctC